MKLVLMLVAFVLLPNYSYSQTAADPVQGHWTLSTRTCSDGKPTHDDFIVGRDSISVEFVNGKYDGKTQIGNCHYWVTGKYETRGHMLRVFNVTGATNCQQTVFNDSSLFFVVEDGLLKLYSGPFSPSGPCSRGEMLESAFRPL